MTLPTRACLYGDGLFETIAYRKGQLQRWSLHWARLQMGLQRLRYPLLTEETLLAQIQPILAALTDDAVVRLTVTRAGARGYRASVDMDIVTDIQVSPIPTSLWHGRGVKTRWCETRWAQQPLLAGIKHINRLEQVLARSEWIEADIEEGLVCDTAGHVISGTMSAILVRCKQQVLIADISQTGIASVARQWALAQLPSLGCSLSVTSLTRADVVQADEVLLMNAIQGVGYVSQLEGFHAKSHSLCDELCALWDN